MPVSHDLRCVFIHIPRCGGCSVEAALSMSLMDQTENRSAMTGWMKSEDLRQRGFPSPVLQHLRLKDLEIIMPISEMEHYFKFTVIRNPFGRLLSIYKFEMNMRRRRGMDEAAFSEYLNNLSEFHRIQQTDYIESVRTNIDFVGRFENLAEDFRVIAERLGKDYTRLLHLNGTSHEHYSRYYNDESVQLVSDMFRDDIAAFGYRFENLA